MPARRSAPAAALASPDARADAGVVPLPPAQPRPALPGGRRLGAHLPSVRAWFAQSSAHMRSGRQPPGLRRHPTAWRRRSKPPTSSRRSGPASRSWDWADRDRRGLPLILAGPAGDLFERSASVLACGLPSSAYGGRPSTSTSGRTAEPVSRRGSRGCPRRRAGAGARGGWPRRRDPRIRELGGQWRRHRHVRRRARPDPRRDRSRGVASDRVGLCLDTAHLWGAGIAIGTPTRSTRSWRWSGHDRPGADDDGPPQRFEGSLRVAGGPHQHLRRARSALKVWPDPRPPGSAHVAYYLETPGMDEGDDAVNMARARDLRPASGRRRCRPRRSRCTGSRARSAGPHDPGFRAGARSAVLGILLAIAAALRLPGLAARGGWDSDQGVDMATLQSFVSHGVLPLLGHRRRRERSPWCAHDYRWPAAIPAVGTDPTRLSS